MLGSLTIPNNKTAPRCSVSAACSSSAPAPRTRKVSQQCQKRIIGTCPVCNADASRCEHAEQPRRREMVIGLGGLLLATAVPLDARADGELVEASPGYSLYYGKGGPPTSYGGYGGNAKETAKYSFEYPSEWKKTTIGKVEKGMQGIDARVVNAKTKAEGAFVITFGRAGEDNKKFKLGDADLTLQGFAGADYDLQDALTTATKKDNYTREVDDRKWFNYVVTGPEFNYLSTITLDEGKVFALFTKSPTKLYKGHEDKFQHIVDSFRINAVVRY
ncbi:hypothetical protein WJX73_006135 [Symbiochloris irregularis]|uniref:PsbP C-terminal domain-containing protein n=1 Tax=Symbiochloris irregularis TaxID=706552 RepID=A0AAW1PYS2_9CHLO